MQTDLSKRNIATIFVLMPNAKTIRSVVLKVHIAVRSSSNETIIPSTTATTGERNSALLPLLYYQCFVRVCVCVCVSMFVCVCVFCSRLDSHNRMTGCLLHCFSRLRGTQKQGLSGRECRQSSDDARIYIYIYIYVDMCKFYYTFMLLCGGYDVPPNRECICARWG